MKRRWNIKIRIFSMSSLFVMLVLALVLHVTPIAASEVTIHSTLFNASYEYSPSPNVVFISDQIGYAFFITAANDNVAYSKTTDGGGSWGSAVALSGNMSTDKNWASVAVWYDRWTPGGQGSKIHIVAAEESTDDIWYNWLNTTDDSMRTDAIVVSQLGPYSPGTEGAPSITKSTDGNLFILAFHNNDRAVHKSTDGGDNWDDTGFPLVFPDFCEGDQGQLLPLSGGDVLLVYQDISTDKAQSKVYDEATDTWDSTWTDIDTWGDDSVYDCNWGTSLFKSTGDIYLAGNTLPDGGTSYPLKAYRFNESTRSWSTLSNIAAVDGALQVTMAVDQNNGDLYAIYNRGSTGGNAQMNVYYKKSTDDGSTWGAESSALNTTADDYRYVRSNLTSNERIYVVWYDDDDDDLFGNTVADITPPTWESYHTDYPDLGGTQCDDFTGSYQTVYMYGEGFEAGHSYHIGYYDHDGYKVDSDGVGTLTGTTLKSEWYFPNYTSAVAGDWHAVAYDDAVTSPPSTYVADDPNAVIDDWFYVQPEAIPEFPTVITAIVVVGLCGTIYYWMRRRLSGAQS